MDLLARRHWIFDMDGTLTMAAHDFQGFKAAVGIPLDRPILEYIASSPPARAARLQQQLHDWEADIARRARPAEDAIALLAQLQARGHRLAILTRNLRELAFITLDAAGLRHHFADEAVLGRDSAAPKPAPDGIHRILRAWGAAPTDSVMVGDYRFDLEAGRAAGTATVLIDRERARPPWTDIADRTVDRLDALLG